MNTNNGQNGHNGQEDEYKALHILQPELEKIIQLKEPKRTLQLQILASKRNQDYSTIKQDFEHLVLERVVGELEKIKKEPNSILRLKQLRELSEANGLDLSVEDCKVLLESYMTEQEIEGEIKAINKCKEPIDKAKKLQELSEKSGLSYEQCQELSKGYLESHMEERDIKKEIKNINQCKYPIEKAKKLRELSKKSGLSYEQCQELSKHYRFDWSDLDFIFKVATIITTLGIFSGVLTYWWETDQRRAIDNNSAWSVVRSAKDEAANNGRIDALQSLGGGCKDQSNFAWLLQTIGLQKDCISLVGINLNSANLPGVNLHKNNLSKANLKNANLESANLQETQLQESDLTGTNLKKVNLKKARLHGTKLEEANLLNADLNGATITNANLEGANLRGADIRNVDLTNTPLQNSRMKGLIYNFNTRPYEGIRAQIEQERMENDVYLICDQSQGEIRAECLIPELEKADLQNIDLSNTYLEKAYLKSANLRKAKLIKANLKNANLTKADLRGADFSDAVLEGVTIDRVLYDEHTKLDRSLFPQATFYKIQEFRGEDTPKPMEKNLQNLENADLSKADLRKVDLRGVNLKNADLEGADLRGANLEGADLTGAKLKGALYDINTIIDKKNPKSKLLSDGKAYYIENESTLEDADLSNRNLEEANLNDGKLKNAKLSRVNLSNASLDRADLTNADLEKADLSSSKLTGAFLSRANLEKANLSGADLEGAFLDEAILTDARIKKYLVKQANLKDASLRKAQLERADLKETILINANLREANLDEAILIKTDLRNANLEQSSLRHADLSNADLRGANLENADLRGANLLGAKLHRTNLKGVLINEDTKVDINENTKVDSQQFKELQKNAYFITKYQKAYFLDKDKKESLEFASSNLYKGLTKINEDKELTKINENIEDKCKKNIVFAQGVVLSNRNLSDVNFSCVNLANISLEKTNLEKANLINTNLSKVNLKGVNLDKAVYGKNTIKMVKPEYIILFDRAYKIAPGSNLYKAELQDKALNGVDLEGANLEEADFNRSHLKGANLEKANLTKAKFDEGSDLTDAKLMNACLNEADLKGANLQGADLTGANLRGADLTGANLDKVIPTNIIYDTDTKYSIKYKYLFPSPLADVNNTNCKQSPPSTPESKIQQEVMDYSNLDVDLSGANFSNYHFVWFGKKTKFNGTTLDNVNFTNAVLEGVNFTDSRLNGVDFTGANLKKVIGLTIGQLNTVKSLKNAQFSPEFCQVITKEFDKPKGGKLHDFKKRIKKDNPKLDIAKCD